MVRLLRRAKDRPADPNLYAGLTHACRYCGLITASIAATEQARRLDPKIRTSVLHSHFMLGEYERVIELKPEPLMHNLTLMMLGREDEARSLLRSVGPIPGRLGIYTDGRRLAHEG